MIIFYFLKFTLILPHLFLLESLFAQERSKSNVFNIFIQKLQQLQKALHCWTVQVLCLSVFLHGKIQWCTSAWYILIMPFYHSAAICNKVRKIMAYWLEGSTTTAMPPKPVLFHRPKFSGQLRHLQDTNYWPPVEGW